VETQGVEENKPFSYKARVEVLPEITAVTYEGLGAKRAKVEVADAEIESWGPKPRLLDGRASGSKWSGFDRAAQPGCGAPNETPAYPNEGALGSRCEATRTRLGTGMGTFTFTFT
jgi:hypothetical protein